MKGVTKSKINGLSYHVNVKKPPFNNSIYDLEFKRARIENAIQIGEFLFRVTFYSQRDTDNFQYFKLIFCKDEGIDKINQMIAYKQAGDSVELDVGTNYGTYMDLTLDDLNYCVEVWNKWFSGYENYNQFIYHE